MSIVPKLTQLSVRLSFLMLAMCAMTISTAKAATVRVQIIDANGEPLENAVVSREGDSQKPLANAVMDQVDTQFLPRVLTVPVGTEVLFPNSDNIRHHVYSFSEAKPFEIQLYANEVRPKVTFDKPGVVALGCNIHDQMRGYIYVSPYAESAISDAQGWVTLNDVDAGAQLMVWHAWLQEAGQAQVTVAYDGKDEQQIQLEVAAPESETKQPSRLQQRFQQRRSGE